MSAVERDEDPRHVVIFDARPHRSVVVHESWLGDLIDKLRAEMETPHG